MNRRECELYDKVTLQLSRIEEGLELLLQQAARDGGPLPDGFWFIHSGLERAAKQMRKALNKMGEESRTPLAVVDNGGAS
jgi:hypothetical protein